MAEMAAKVVGGAVEYELLLLLLFVALVELLEAKPANALLLPKLEAEDPKMFGAELAEDANDFCC